MPDHHALLYISKDLSLSFLPPELLKPSADNIFYDVKSFGIDDARNLSDNAYRKPVAGEFRTFIIKTRAITNEAQNALLKLLEEPPATARFILALTHSEGLIPTLLSRLQLVRVNEDIAPSEIWLAFTKLSIADKLNAIAEAVKKKDNVWMDVILENMVSSDKLPAEEIILLAKYKDRKGSSRKMLLEFGVLTMTE